MKPQTLISAGYSLYATEVYHVTYIFIFITGWQSNLQYSGGHVSWRGPLVPGGATHHGYMRRPADKSVGLSQVLSYSTLHSNEHTHEQIEVQWTVLSLLA